MICTLERTPAQARSGPFVKNIPIDRRSQRARAESDDGRTYVWSTCEIFAYAEPRLEETVDGLLALENGGAGGGRSGELGVGGRFGFGMVPDGIVGGWSARVSEGRRDGKGFGNRVVGWVVLFGICGCSGPGFVVGVLFRGVCWPDRVGLELNVRRRLVNRRMDFPRKCKGDQHVFR